MPALTEKEAQKLLKGISIPPQPQIVVDLQIEMSMPDVNLDKINQIICKDVGISGSVLKVVNSPFFGLRNHITSIRQALSLLGLKNVINVVNSLAMRQSLTFSELKELTIIWDNAMDVALVAAALAKMLGVCSSDEAYTLGLFHDTGIHLLIGKHENYLKVLRQAYSHPNQRVTEVENELLSTNHAVVGYYVARAWNLPLYLSEAIADHHKSEAIFAEHVACDDKKKNLLAILKLAENTCKDYRTLGHQTIDYEFERIKTDLLIYLGLSSYDVQMIQAEIMDMGLLIT